MAETKSSIIDGSNEEASKRLEELIKQYETEEKEKERKD